MATTITGRRKDEGGEPIAGTGIDIERDGPIAERLRERIYPLMSNPVTGEWATGLVSADETGGKYATGLGIFPPGNAGPPEHYHIGYEETFEVIRGEFVVEMDDEAHQLSAGEEVTVPPEQPHSFRNVGEEIGATVTTARPAARTLDVIQTLYGLAHEGELTTDGEPSFWQGMALTAAMSADTVFTSPPPAVTQPLATVLAPVANALGYRATYSRYETDAFWRRHVEQPEL